MLLATGVIDVEPDLPDLPDALRRGLIRHCGICDGYEVTGHRVGVIGHGPGGLHEALFLRTYTPHLTLLSLGTAVGLSPVQRRQAAEAGITFVEAPVASVRITPDGRVGALCVQGGVWHAFDTVYSALGSIARSDLAGRLDAVLDDAGCVVTDRHQHSSVDGLFAAGDVVQSLDQIGVAMGEAAIAATAIHNRLRGMSAAGLPAGTLSTSHRA